MSESSCAIRLYFPSFVKSPRYKFIHIIRSTTTMINKNQICFIDFYYSITSFPGKIPKSKASQNKCPERTCGASRRLNRIYLYPINAWVTENDGKSKGYMEICCKCVTNSGRLNTIDYASTFIRKMLTLPHPL